MAEAEFTSSSGGVRAPSVNAKKELSDEEHEKRFRVGSSSPGRFRAWANRSYPEGNRLLLCTSTERATLAVLKRISQRKSAERRNKMSVRFGKDSRAGKPR